MKKSLLLLRKFMIDIIAICSRMYRISWMRVYVRVEWLKGCLIYSSIALNADVYFFSVFDIIILVYLYKCTKFEIFFCLSFCNWFQTNKYRISHRIKFYSKQMMNFDYFVFLVGVVWPTNNHWNLSFKILNLILILLF